MKEQRRHQRIRFNSLPLMRIGQFGFAGKGQLENLSLVGMMLRTELPLKVGKALGCEFAVFDSPLIDLSTVVVSRIGNLYGARFQAGPISEWLIQEAIDNALTLGKASVLSINELQGRKVMRIAGGLNAGLRNDFMHSLTKMGVDEMDLSGVTEIDSAGIELCRIAVDQHRVGIVRPSSCVLAVMAA
ncbi:MAG: PilZ domain-containing protein [Propionivibrio sp.]|uniref:PilZ domain-containing protein n=1 Tax=Propionivibrio sp. TaxID=2212460 RepID=UPI001A4D4D91|nr:PilZ domain-containing protein [Propionivibrio sp.]MBL8414856.1 PilZ domain-containing protein [Propionivibrio sp.]